MPEDRPLSPEEHALTRWLLEHGTPEAAHVIGDLAHARVISRCPCGCASVDFAIPGRETSRAAGMQILADYQWRDSEGHLGGVFVFARQGMLAGLEVWSIDGEAAIDRLPPIDSLRLLGEGPAA